MTEDNDGSFIATMDSIELEEKKVLLRVDFNCPLDESKSRLLDYTRIVSHSQTIKELLSKGASVVVLTHQGRPGMSDFSDLSLHYNILRELIGNNVEFIDDVIGPSARKLISELEPGRVLLLDNVRFLAEEMIEASGEFHAKSIMVSKLAPLFDIFVNDAFATAHRKHASIVGFPYRLPSIAGRIMEKEVLALKDIKDPTVNPKFFVLGGAKLTDSIRIVYNLLKNGKNTFILLTGLVAELFMMGKGIEIGELNKILLDKRGGFSLLPRVKELLLEYGDKIVTPLDFITEYKDGNVKVEEPPEIQGLIRDIGPKTIEAYSKLFHKARVIVFRGPAGVMEKREYMKGTVELIENATETQARIILGGGHLNSVMNHINNSARDKIHNSTGGGALLLFLSGDKLPALEALKDSAIRYRLKGIPLK